MATIPGYDELLQCPYEKSHQILANAMSKHLFKCRKNHPGHKYVTCPFNVTHHVAEPELKLHMKDCEDRASFESYKYCISSHAPNATQLTPPVPKLVYNNAPPKPPSNKECKNLKTEKRVETKPAPSLLDSDSWDDVNVPAYDPQKHCINAKVIRKATLKKPSEKKAFYESERLRLKSLKLTD